MSEVKIEIRNARIVKPRVILERGCWLNAGFTLEGHGWGTNFGLGYVQGIAIDLFMVGVMKCFEVDNWASLHGMHLRAECKGLGSPITRIMHIVEERHFDIDEWALEAKAREALLNPVSEDPKQESALEST